MSVYYRRTRESRHVLVDAHYAGDNMKVEIKQKPAMRLATIHHVGSYMNIGQTFAKLGEIAQAEGLFRHKGATMVGVYYDDADTTPAEKLRADAGIAIPEDATLPATLVEQRIPAGSCACTTHVGPYSGLGAIWRHLMREWLPSSGKRMRGAGFEIYHNLPGQVPPEELRTEICVPIS